MCLDLLQLDCKSFNALPIARLLLYSWGEGKTGTIVQI